MVHLIQERPVRRVSLIPGWQLTPEFGKRIMSQRLSWSVELAVIGAGDAPTQASEGEIQPVGAPRRQMEDLRHKRL